MALEVCTRNKKAQIKILSHEGSVYRVLINDKEYELDVEKVEAGVYSILYKGQSINMEMIERDQKTLYTVNTYSTSYEIEVMDTHDRLTRPSSHKLGGQQANILAPMPGKVVKLLVEEGDEVEVGQPILVLSAMKMDSEYHAAQKGMVKSVLVSEGDAVQANQLLVEIEALSGVLVE